MSGSTLSLLASVEPDIVKSTQGETSHAHAGTLSPASRSVLISATVSPPPALSPPTAILRRVNSLTEEEPPGRQRVFERCRERMLGCQPITDGQRPHASRPARLGHHAPMAEDRSRAIAPAMKKHQNPRGIAPRCDRPFRRHASGIDRRDLDIICHRPNRADFIDALASFRPPDRSRLGTQQRADCVDFSFEPWAPDPRPNHESRPLMLVLLRLGHDSPSRYSGHRACHDNPIIDPDSEWCDHSVR